MSSCLDPSPEAGGTQAFCHAPGHSSVARSNSRGGSSASLFTALSRARYDVVTYIAITLPLRAHAIIERDLMARSAILLHEEHQ